jgi:hypothetical protein
MGNCQFKSENEQDNIKSNKQFQSLPYIQYSILSINTNIIDRDLMKILLFYHRLITHF